MLQFPPIPRRVAYHAEGSVSELTKVFSPSAMATGPETETFETEAAATLGVKRAVAVPSARYALRVLLKCLGLPAGGEVVLPAYTDPSMPEAIVRAGLKPVFVDIRTTDDNMNEDEAAAKINSNTCAILATHIFGNPCAIDRLASLARKYCLALIEDFSHSVGARFGGKYVGTFGTAGICTFNSSKFFNTPFDKRRSRRREDSFGTKPAARSDSLRTSKICRSIIRHRSCDIPTSISPYRISGAAYSQRLSPRHVRILQKNIQCLEKHAP